MDINQLILDFKTYHTARKLTREAQKRALKTSDPAWTDVNRSIDLLFQDFAEKKGFVIKGVGGQGNAAKSTEVKFLYQNESFSMKTSNGIYPFIFYCPETQNLTISLAHSIRNTPHLPFLNRIEDEILNDGGYTEHHDNYRFSDKVHHRYVMLFNANEHIEPQSFMSRLETFLDIAAKVFERNDQDIVKFIKRGTR